MTPTLRLLLTIITGFAVNAILTPIITFFAHRNAWYDERNHRKIHTEDTPRLGGVSIYLSFLIATFVAMMVSGDAAGGLPPMMGPQPGFMPLLLYYLPIIGGMTVIFLVGLVDDFNDLRAVVKFVIQIIAAAIVTLGPFRIHSITIPFVWYQLDFGVFSYPITIIYIVAVANAMNFIDGVDGLAGGSAAISALFFAVIAVVIGQSVTTLVAVGLLGSLLGFLVYNVPPAKTFMGDSGSYTIGFALAMFPIIFFDGTGQTLDLIPGLTVLALPVLDLATSTLRRLRRGTHPFSADREHIHHKLIDLGLGKWRLLGVVYGSGIVAGVAAFSWYLLPANVNAGVILAVWTAAVILVSLLTRATGHSRAVSPAATDQSSNS